VIFIVKADSKSAEIEDFSVKSLIQHSKHALYFTRDSDSVQYSIKGGERFRHSLHRDSPTNSPREFVRYRDRLPTPQRPRKTIHEKNNACHCTYRTCYRPAHFPNKIGTEAPSSSIIFYPSFLRLTILSFHDTLHLITKLFPKGGRHAQYIINEARNNLSDLVKSAEEGEVVAITRYDKPIAVIISYAEYESKSSKEID